MAVVPWGDTITLFGRQISLSVANINVGILYITAITSISVYGIVLAGWSSNNKYAMMGGIRSTAQMISYELALGLGFIGPILLAGSMSLLEIVKASRKYGWFVLWQPVGAFIFLIATLAEVNRAPFDMPEAEQELTAGYHTEYSGMKFALFFMAEYIKMIAVSAIAATLFFGGYRWSLCGPGVPGWVHFICCQGCHPAVWDDLGARHAAAHPLRPADGFRLEDHAAHRPGKCFYHGYWDLLNAFWLISILTILFMILVVYMARNAIGKAGGRRYAE